METSPRIPAIRIAIITLLCGLSISALLAHFKQRSNEQQLHETVAAATETATRAIEGRLAIYKYGLLSARGAVVAAGEWGISRNEFHRFSLTRDIDIEFPGARGFGFIRRVAESEELRFLRRAQADDKPDFAIRQLTPHAGERFVIQYIEPEQHNQAAIGLDIASERNRREAALTAMRTGSATLTGPITLMQAADKGQHSFLFLLPIYSSAVTPTNPSDREVSLLGWSYAPLLMSDVLADLRIDNTQTHLSLWDITNPKDPQQFYQSDDDGLRIVYTHRMERDIYGRRWLIAFSVYPAFVAKLNQIPALHVFMANGFFSLILAILSGVFTIYWRQRQQVTAEQAQLAAIVSNSSDAIIGKTLDGVVTSWNAGAERIFGFSTVQAIGQHVADLIVPDALKNEEVDILRRIGHGEIVMPFETQRLRRDGSLIDVSVAVSPIRGASGRVVGASKTVRDITEKKAAELAILNLNANLEQQVRQRTGELAKTNQLLTDVLSSASEISIIATDRDGIIEVFNTGSERMLGYRADEMIGKCTPAIIHVADEMIARGAELSAEFGTTIEGFRVFVHKPELEGSETREWTYVRKDGSRLLVSLVATAIRDSSGEIEGYLGIAIDISVRKAAEQALAASLETTRAILNTAQNPIITIDATGIVRSFNPAAERDFGYAAAEIVGQNIKLLMPEPHQSEHDGHISRYLRDGYSQIIGRVREVIAQRKDGSIFPVQLSIGEMAVAGERMFVGMLIDLSALQQQRNELVTVRDQMLLAAEVAELGVWTVEIEAQTLQWNDRMFEIYDLPVSLRDSGLSFQIWGERLHPEDAAAAKLHLESAIEKRATYADSFRIIVSGGRVRYVQARGQIICNASGKPIRVTGINRDVTDQTELQARLTYAKEQADAASAAKSAFLANMSHEIRTPMNAVLGMLQLVQKTDLDTRQRDYIDKANSAAKSLLGLLNDILDYSKIEAGKLELDLHVFELETLMRDLAIVLSGNQGTKDVELIFDIAPTLPSALIGDSLRLQQILINLAGNALKFTERGHVEVSVSELDRSGDRVHLCICVTDTGIGISPEQQARIFEGFTQAEASTTRRFGGTGLGLGIAQRLVSMMGSTLLLDSQPGKGSRFWFDIELAVAQPTALPPPLPTAITPSGVLLTDDDQIGSRIMPQLAGLRVLVVEDNALNRQIAAELLTGEGAHVQLAEGGLDGVAQVLSGKATFDVVIMDIQMPDIDGLEATRRIRSDPRFRDLPIVAMTANASQADREQCLAAGMNEYIGKPIDLDELVLTLMALRHPQLNESLPTPVDTRASSRATDADNEELTSILRRFGGKIDLFRTMLAQFKIEAPKLLDELSRQTTDENWAGAAATLHTLKGNASTIGIRATARRMAELELDLQAADKAAKLGLINIAVIADLKQQLATSIAQLEVASDHQAEESATRITTEPLTPELWRSRLSEALRLLESNNMQAIELVEALAAVTPRDQQTQFGRLFTQVESLDFIAAAATVRTFLQGA